MNIKDGEKLDDLDPVCETLNRAAHQYVLFALSSVVGQELTEICFNKIIKKEIMRCGFPLVNSMLLNSFALIGRCADIAVNEGDLVTLAKEDIENGMKYVKKNPKLLSDYVIPLLLYSIEYHRLAYETIQPKDLTLSDGTQRSPSEYQMILHLLVSGSIQTRYFHIREWSNKKDLGIKESKNLDRQHIKPGRIIYERE